MVLVFVGSDVGISVSGAFVSCFVGVTDVVVGEFVCELFMLQFWFLALCAANIPKWFHIIFSDISKYFIALLILINSCDCSIIINLLVMHIVVNSSYQYLIYLSNNTRSIPWHKSDVIFERRRRNSYISIPSLIDIHSTLLWVLFNHLWSCEFTLVCAITLQNTETQTQTGRLMGSFRKLLYHDFNECNMFIQYCRGLHQKESSCGQPLTGTLYGKFCALVDCWIFENKLKKLP